MKTCTNARAIHQILCAIERTVNCMNIAGFSVTIEITTENGVIYPVSYRAGTVDRIRLSKSCLCTENVTISLDSIAKIVILHGTADDPRFQEKLTREIYSIMRGVGSCVDAGEFVQCLQKFINCNKFDIEGVNYNGGLETIQPIAAISDIETRNVVGSVDVASTTVTAVGSAVMNVTDTQVVENVTVSDEEVVTSVVTSAETVVGNVNVSTTRVSPPVTLTETQVVTEVTLNPQVTNIVTAIDTTTESVRTVESLTTASAATGFSGYTDVANVLGGITNAAITRTTAYTDAPITVDGAGPMSGMLQVLVLPDTFGPGIPQVEVPLYVLVNGDLSSRVTVGQARTIHGLAGETTVLAGVTGAPTSTNLSIPAALETGDFVTDVLTTQREVAGAVTFTSEEGTAIQSVQTGTINNPTVGESPVSVVSEVTPVMETVGTVNVVQSVPLSQRIDVARTAVVETAGLTTTRVNTVGAVTVDTTMTEVVSGINTSTVSVMAPSREDIDGDVVCAGNGIMTVENYNGDISLYNICDINGVDTGTV